MGKRKEGKNRGISKALANSRLANRGGILQISGERSKEQEEKNDKWHRVERSSGKFLRRFRLPENAKLEQVKAAMENGVLTVTVPKEEVKKPEMKAIDISG
ncbi:class I heat shock protein-like [Salvia miltiorrhiza]|uniref:class I heat shock protein-like n=1 Tax=Salvia miltiorrhiza TaxID=226208 RepID=UPI0025AC092E|nr:class I heat shock protein-like [Salvia miltiorrhiza]